MIESAIRWGLGLPIPGTVGQHKCHVGAVRRERWQDRCKCDGAAVGQPALVFMGYENHWGTEASSTCSIRDTGGNDGYEVYKCEIFETRQSSED